MIRCPACSRDVPEDSRFCPACGAAVKAAGVPDSSHAVTHLSARDPGRSATRSGAPPSTPFVASHGRFVPGELIAGRYRIVSILGAGGMGEVYRADDLKLDQAVALKFLPEAVERDAGRLERLLGEVRLARQVAHPNICRVYDIGEADGRHFLSMEFVDGEDLGNLLRRIGRLPHDKAVEVARQICAGLAAAHDQEILHRDLKPANIMIDGRGRARITDFGLAIPSSDATGVEVLTGTPAYMAPEQRAGREVTARSDLYALGLVLYELFTGKPAFDVPTLQEMARMQDSGTPPPSPSTVLPDFDPTVERAILRCLESDPARRPSSALQVLGSLPGGDPLAAALAAGETPSPEMVAAAGGEGLASPRRAWTLLVGTLLLVGAIVAIAPYSTDLGLSHPPKAPAVLTDRARTLAAAAGYAAEPADEAVWLARAYDPMRYVAGLAPSPQWRERFAPWGPPMLLCYRQAPQALVPRSPTGTVTAQDPPFLVPGMVSIELTMGDRLSRFTAVPPAYDSSAVTDAGVDAGATTAATAAAAGTEAEWSAFFTAAGLDRTAFREVSPRWVPTVPFDRRSEWTGVAPWATQVPLTVSAASWRGRPVSFEVRGPWAKPTRTDNPVKPGGLRIAGIINSVLVLFMLALAVFLAWRNVQQGRGDLKGAGRLAAFMFVLGMVSWLARAHHVGDVMIEIALFFNGLGPASFQALAFALVYLAVEPSVRRITPELLIGWVRILDGRFRDPRVGRDLLMGIGVGAAQALVIHVVNALPTWVPFRGQTGLPVSASALLGGRGLVAFLGECLMQSIGPSLFLFGLYFVLRFVLRRTLAATLAFGVILFGLSLGGENFALEAPAMLLYTALYTWVLTRHGLLAGLVAQFAFSVLVKLPLPLAAGAYYNAASVVLLAALVGLTVHAFVVSLGTRPAAAGAPVARAASAA